MSGQARSRRRRGFTLLELMIAVMVTSIGVALAAKVAQVVIRQSGKGRQSTDFHSRARLVTRQLRNDLRSAGVGSTGAVAIDRAVPVWGAMALNTPAGFDAIPVVAGVNGLGATPVGGRTTVGGSDAVQVVVVDPASAHRALGYNPAGQDIIALEPPVDPASPPFRCPSNMVFVSDHSSPTGQGRTQLFFVESYPLGALNMVGDLQFTVGSGSDVMCARLSTYWVDAQGWLHRSDLTAPTAPIVPLGGQVWVDPSNVAGDALTPGVLDVQVAYRVSAEVYTQNGQPPPVAQPERTWAFEGVAGNADGLMSNRMWFEVRMVRVNLLMRTMRTISTGGGARNIARVEDAAALPPIPLTRDLQAEWVTATEALTNLRYFDLGAPSGTVAEPY